MKQLFLAIISLISVSNFAQSDISSSTFNNIQAVWYGPGTLSGRITSIVGVDSQPQKIFIGTAGGGVWLTENGGATFKNKFEKYCQSIGALAIDPKNSRTIYVGTGESNMRNTVSYGEGIYKSTDDGNSWDKIGLDSTEHISKIIIDPSNSNTLYVSAPGPLWSNSPHRGLYKSIDAGKTWKKILYINEKTGCADIVLNPTNPSELLASMWEFRRTPYSFNSGGKSSGLYKSIDGGATWKKINILPDSLIMGRIALALSPSKPSHILAIVESKSTGLYESNDGGLTWQRQSTTMNVESRPFYFSTLAFDPKNDNRVYRPAYEFSISNDAGKSFTEASNDGVWLHSDHHAIWINPNYTNQIWLGTDGGVFLSNNQGASWIFIPNLPVGQLYHCSYDMKEPYNVYVGLQDNGSHMAPSQDYGEVNNGSWRPIYGGDGFWVQADPDGKTAYAEYQGGNASRIDLKTGVTSKINPTQVEGQAKLRYNWNTPLYLGAKNPKNLYMAAQFLYKSTNQGRDWSLISPDLTTNDPAKQKQEESGGLSEDNTSAENHCTIYTIAESPLDENLIAVGTDDGNLQISVNAGKSWTNVSSNYAKTGIPAQTWITSIDLSPFDKNTIYATFDNHNYGDFNTYLAVSHDLGKTWQRINFKDFKGFASKIKQDVKNKNLLFLGTERGLWISIDAGLNWFKYKNNMNEMAMVRDIAIHPRDNDVLIGTHGNGLLVLRNITDMRSMDSTIAKKSAYLYPIPSTKISYGDFESGFPYNLGFTTPNKPHGVNIDYYFKKKIISGDIELKIYDMNNKLVRKLNNTNKRGINTENWNMQMTPPRVAVGGSKPDWGMFIGPYVLPGKYRAIMIAGKDTLSQHFEVLLNPDNNMTMEDCKKQFDAAQKCVYLHESLATLVDSVNVVELKMKQSKTQDTASQRKLADFKNTLLATKSKSVFADEKRLRENITEVYSSVVFQPARPSNLQEENIRFLESKLKKSITEWDKLKPTLKY